jgi:hypothetical protein
LLKKVKLPVNKTKVLKILNEAFKTLDISNIEMIEMRGPIIKVRVIATGYEDLSFPERSGILTPLIRNTSMDLSLNYLISIEPLTPAEYAEVL